MCAHSYMDVIAGVVSYSVQDVHGCMDACLSTVLYICSKWEDYNDNMIVVTFIRARHFNLHMYGSWGCNISLNTFYTGMEVPDINMQAIRVFLRYS